MYPIVLGEFSRAVADILLELGLVVEPGTPIYLGETNANHMRRSHPRDYRRYGNRLSEFIGQVQYLSVHDDGSILFIRKYSEYVTLAVRVAGDELYYARSVFRLDERQTEARIRIRQIISLT